jgi:micrococcal nuclease
MKARDGGWVRPLIGGLLVLACNVVSVTPPPLTPAPSPVPPVMPAGLVLARVTHIRDGDTIEVSINNSPSLPVRLIGIDTPENAQCYDNEATAQMRALVVNQDVLLEADPSQDDKDRFQRLLRYVWLQDGRSVNHLLVADGFAFEYTFRTAYKYQAAFKVAEQYAKAGQRGLWSPATCDGKTGRR